MRSILLTGGDPASIAPEIILQALPAFWKQASYRKTNITYFANAGVAHRIQVEASCRQYQVEYIYCSIKEWPNLIKTVNFSHHKRRLIYCELKLEDLPHLSIFSKAPKNLLETKVIPGEPNRGSGALGFVAFSAACDLIDVLDAMKGGSLRRESLALVTAPIAKEWVAQSGIVSAKRFTGHTGYLAQRFCCEVFMLLHGRQLSVIPLTEHIPLRHVPRQLKRVLMRPALLENLHQLQKSSAYGSKKWALCGLNPHAGENGLLGNEERFLEQWQAALCEKGMLIEGPLSADGLFMEANRSQYRLVLGCYHDQVLIPFKALEGFGGVNCTLALPFLRTSPDHGTAFALVGRGKSDALSMQRALEVAASGFA